MVSEPHLHQRHWQPPGCCSAVYNQRVNASVLKTIKPSLPYLALVATGVTATLVFLILPILVGGLAEQFGWGDREVGWLAAADMGGSALASLAMAVAISKVDWKKSALLAIVFVIAGNLVSVFVESLPLLLLVRVLTGISNGVILSVVFAGLCRSSNPDRFFGVYVFAQLSLQVLLLPLTPTVIAWGGMTAVFIFLAGASAASGLLVRYFPDPESGGEGSAQSFQMAELSNAADSRKWGILALAAQGLYFLAPAAIWGYFESIGETFSLSMATVGEALGLGAIAGIIGGVTVVVLGNRFGRFPSMCLGTAISLLAVWLLMSGSGFYGFLMAAALLNFSWNYTFPYQMGTLSLFDRNGSIAVLSLLVQTFSLSFGPLLASFVLVAGNFSPVLVACMACYMGSLLLFYISSLHGSGAKPSNP